MDDTQIEMLPMLGEFSSIASQYEHIMFYYESGIQQIVAKLQILNNEFKNNHERNPIENIKSRVKSLDSIIDKMKRKGIPLTTNAMKREIKDIAGVRVICPFISDVYRGQYACESCGCRDCHNKGLHKKTEGEWLQESSYDSAG